MKGKWTKELHSVLWAYHTTTQSTTDEMPYRLTFGSEAMIPVEVGEPNWRRMNFDEDRNDQDKHIDLDLLSEDQELVILGRKQLNRELQKNIMQKL